MKLLLINREQIQSLGSFLVSELDSIVSRVRGAWSVEHNDDDTHAHVHADSTSTGRLTLSDIVSDTISVATIDNYSPGGLITAAILRLNSALSAVSITGLHTPQDESDAVLDGRALVVENISTTATFALEQEHTGSSPRNRFNLPWNPTTTNTSARLLMFPGSLCILVYNAAKARWMLVSRSNDEVVAYVTFASNQNDFTASGFSTAKEIRLDPTAANLTISGFDVTGIPAPTHRKVTNVGLYKCAILHQSTSSVAANRVACPGGVRYMLNPRESVDLYRDTEVGWRILEKANQFIDVAHSAGDYLASAGTWTVDSADLVTLCYRIDGNEMTVSFRILNTDVSAAPTTLTFPIPNGRTAARTIRNVCTIRDAGAAEDFGRVEVTAGGTTIAISKKAAAAFTATAGDNTDVIGEITFYVQDAAAGMSENHSDTAHGDTAHADAEHSDVAHSDVAHGDTHTDSSHTDAAHGDVAHSDVAHVDSAHVDVAHTDVAHDDVAHSDIPDTHEDSPHTDHNDLGSAEEHADIDHFDSGSSHGDSEHADAAHSDGAHSDVAHVDTAHSDTAHSDTAHVDGGHGDSHSDTAAHADVAHVDNAHADTAHADNIHVDVGMHTDAAHSDI